QVTTIAPQPQKIHTPRQAKRGQDTEIPQSSGPPKKVGDEAVYTREDDRVETSSGSRPRRQATAFGEANAQTRRKSLDKENVSKQRRNLKTRIEEGDFDDDFDDIDDMVDKVIEYVEGDTINTGGAFNTTTIGVSAASASVTTAGVSISTVEPRTPPTTTNAFKDEDLTITQTLLKMRSEKAKEKGMDEELALRLHKEEKDELERIQRDRYVQEEASNAALTAKFDDVQARIDADALLAARLQEEEREQFFIDEQARFLVVTITERKRFFAT
nr:hypothetical protein [Tanacetum cinerariifolium]